MSASSVPDVVLLVDDDLEALAATLESVTAELPGALVHLVRPGIPAVDVFVERLAAAGLSVLDVEIGAGLPDVIGSIAGALGERRWCYLFGGERLPEGAGPELQRGAQLTAAVELPWLGSTPSWCRPRVHDGDHVAETPSGRFVQLAVPPVSRTWAMVIARALRNDFDTFEELIDDISTLAHLGEIDAAFQRAELSWRTADRDHEVALIRTSVLLADLLDLGPAALAAAARWYRLEPEPFVVMAYVRAAAGCVPFALVDRMLAQVPRGAVEYHDGSVRMSVEETTRLRNHIDHHRLFATTALEAGLRSYGDPDGGPAEAGTFGSALLLDVDPATLVGRLDPDPEVGTRCLARLRADLDHQYLDAVMDAFVARFGERREIADFASRVAVYRPAGGGTADRPTIVPDDLVHGGTLIGARS